MLALIVQGILLYGLSLACWRIVRRYVLNTALDNIPGPPSPSFFKGNFQQLGGIHAWGFHEDIAAKYGRVIKVKGLFGENQLYVFDLKALHHIVVKDQYVYERSAEIIQQSRVIFGKTLSNSLGEQHRRQRKMLSPAFSIAHMREMVPLFYSVTHRLRDSIAKKVSTGPQEIDVSRWMSRTALELIGQSGLGYSFDTLAEDVAPHPYFASMKRLGPAMMPFALLRSCLWGVANIGTPKFRRFIVDMLPWKKLHDVRDIIDTLHETSVEIVQSKKKAMLEGDEAVTRQVGQGKDIMSILMRANMDAFGEDKLDDSEVVSQVSALTFAAVETTSNALSRILHLLSQHQDIQDKLRREITEAHAKNENLAYDELVSLPYLDAICRETLRLYPPVSQLSRTTRKDMTLPLSKPLNGVDGKDIHEVHVPNGTNIMVSIIAVNRNPEIWGPDSLEWIPERWLAPLPTAVSDARVPGIYSHLMTFLGGGRACIGFKFSQLEMKVVLSLLIQSFHFAPSNKEVYWQMTHIATPSVVGEGSKVQLPLRVSKVIS